MANLEVVNVVSWGVLVDMDLTESRASGVARETKRPNVRAANIVREQKRRGSLMWVWSLRERWRYIIRFVCACEGGTKFYGEVSGTTSAKGWSPLVFTPHVITIFNLDNRRQ